MRVSLASSRGLLIDESEAAHGFYSQRLSAAHKRRASVEVQGFSSIDNAWTSPLPTFSRE
jgi:hypothetical protein